MSSYQSFLSHCSSVESDQDFLQPHDTQRRRQQKPPAPPQWVQWAYLPQGEMHTGEETPQVRHTYTITLSLPCFTRLLWKEISVVSRRRMTI